MIVATHADSAAGVTDERRSVAETSSAVVDTVAVKFADDFDVVQRLFAINCQRPTYTELKALRLCLAEIRTSIVSVSVTTTTTTVLRPFFWDHPGEPVPEEKFWTFLVQGKINRGRHTDHPAGMVGVSAFCNH